ncbi:MAG TPA: cytochrome c biogenesis protein CcsA [Phycisphaerae bacterium]|jgi:ABC-type uncharacterized transport system permease subunit
MPTLLFIQFSLLVITSLLFCGAFLLGLLHMKSVSRAMASASIPTPHLPHQASMGIPARTLVIAGTLVGTALLAWRAVSQSSLALAVSNPFDAFLLLALLLSLTLMYFRWTRHLRGLAFFLLPMIVILLAIGVFLSAIHLQQGAESQDYHNVWYLIHVIAIITSTLCFTLACAGGIVYLIADRQLRRKGLDTSHRWIGLPPLGSIEKFNRWMIYCGFPLLSIATVAGLLRILQAHGQGTNSQPAAEGGGHTKIAFGILSWLVYAVLLHVPASFRGRRAAWLSIIGFALFIAAYIAAKWS